MCRQGAVLVDDVDVITAFLVGTEGKCPRVHRRGDGRAEPGDSADAAIDVGHLRDRSRRGVHDVDVADAALIRHEEQPAAIGVPLRVDVLAAREGRQRFDASQRDVVERQPVVARIEKAALVSRSMTNAMRLPSGDQAGCRSANRSLITVLSCEARS